MSEKGSITLFCQEFRSISDTVLASKENQGKKCSSISWLTKDPLDSYQNTVDKEKICIYFLTNIDSV